jgi:SAM-dependent methyltransferase
MRVLDLGGGNGYQASIIASLGCKVVSIDIADRPKSLTQYFTVIDYDGFTIPFADMEFDIVFSSHVLEHVREPQKLLAEIHRVMKPGAHGIYILPAATWRLSAIAAHYVYAIKYLFGKRDIPGLPVAPTLRATAHRKGLIRAIARAVFPAPHGEYASAVAELYCYTRLRWCRVFRNSQFRVDSVRPNRVFCTGFGLFPSLSLASRRRLATVFGSSSTTFVLSAS